MNIGEVSVKNDRVVFVTMFFVLLGGFVAYQQMGRLEDPEFTIKEALIITPYPGASSDEVAKEVTNPIESACQQLGQLQRVESESTRGMSVVSAITIGPSGWAIFACSRWRWTTGSRELTWTADAAISENGCPLSSRPR